LLLIEESVCSAPFYKEIFCLKNSQNQRATLIFQNERKFFCIILVFFDKFYLEIEQVGERRAGIGLRG